MFTEARPTNRRWNSSLLVSFVLHCVVIYLLVRPPRPIYVTPSSIAFGHGGTSTELVYLSQHGSIAAQDAGAKPEPSRIALRSSARAPQAQPETRGVE